MISKDSAVKINYDHELIPMLAEVMGLIYARNMDKSEGRTALRKKRI